MENDTETFKNNLVVSYEIKYTLTYDRANPFQGIQQSEIKLMFIQKHVVEYTVRYILKKQMFIKIRLETTPESLWKYKYEVYKQTGVSIQ